MDSVAEEWRDIPGFDGYQASTHGRIRSLDRLIHQRCRWGGTMTHEYKGRVLTAHPNLRGYFHVSVGSPARTQTVHKLVSLAFIGHRPDDVEVNHKDGNKANNCPGNLEYTTPSGNMIHAFQTGLRRIRITADKVEEIQALIGRVSLREIGRRYGVNHNYIRYIRDGKRKVI